MDFYSAKFRRQRVPSLYLFGKIRQLNIVTVGILLFILASCATQEDSLPMYGGMERNTIPEIKTADEKLIQENTKFYGSRENASAVFVNRGFKLYQEHDLDGAMRRFNQAWILNPNNPEVYWGFASVLHNQGENCESMSMIEKALGFNTYFTGLYPDAGRIIVLCTVSDAQQEPAQKVKNFQRSEKLFGEAVEKDINKGYVYALWATAYYWQEQYEEAWNMVQKSKENGGQVSDQFLSLLSEKMPEPSMK
ncbi:MAG: hypothetical protein VST68_11110 [Nitrospirota bacterium]|nr:hypothetical protein [Nitrospirota bacterium]